MDGVMAERDFDLTKIFAKSNQLSGTTLLIRVWNSTDNGATWTEIALVKISDGNREGTDAASAFIQATSLYCFSVEAIGGPYFGPVSYLCI
jgi:hypothetical protein